MMDLAKEILTHSKLEGEFVLRTGQTANIYFDKYRFESQPKILGEIAKRMAPLLPQGIDALAGLEMGGIPIATALSLETGLPCLFVRKEAKTYGTCRFAEGLDIQGKKLCVIEDVVTTGGQVKLSTNDLRGEGAIVENILSVIYRGDPNSSPFSDIDLEYKYLFSKEDLV